ncbi:MAG: hypothetical protein ABI687_02905 [Flavitalea sp.]
MKRMFFCLLILLAFSRTTTSYAIEVLHVNKVENTSKESFSSKYNIRESSGDIFYYDLLEIAEDDTNDPEDEESSVGARYRENIYSVSSYSYNSFLRRIHYNRDFSCQSLPVFILGRALRL